MGLIPRNNKYFKTFNTMAREVERAAGLLCRVFDEFEFRASTADQIKTAAITVQPAERLPRLIRSRHRPRPHSRGQRCVRLPPRRARPGGRRGPRGLD